MYICSLWWVSMCLCSCSVWPGCACVSCQVLLRRRRLGGGSLGDPLQFRFGTVSGNPSPNQVTGLGNKWKSVAAQNLSWPPPFFPGSFRPRGVLQRAAIKKIRGLFDMAVVYVWEVGRPGRATPGAKEEAILQSDTGGGEQDFSWPSGSPGGCLPAAVRKNRSCKVLVRTWPHTK